jgi:DNA-binding IclR family transcriptional regulator
VLIRPDGIRAGRDSGPRARRVLQVDQGSVGLWSLVERGAGDLPAEQRLRTVLTGQVAPQDLFDHGLRDLLAHFGRPIVAERGQAERGVYVGNAVTGQRLAQSTARRASASDGYWRSIGEVLHASYVSACDAWHTAGVSMIGTYLVSSFQAAAAGVPRLSLGDPMASHVTLGVRGGKPSVGEPVIERAFRLLYAFGPADRSLSLTSLSVRSGVPKSSALRLARKLIEAGALERLESGDFVIGLRLLEIASLAPRGHGLRATALPYMEDLHGATRQHVLLAVRDGHEAVLVERLSAHQAGRVMYRVGGRLPLYATGVGLCLLAHSPAELQEEILSGDLVLTPENDRLSPGELRRRLAEVRREGIAVVTRPSPEPMISVAGPVFGPGDKIIASLSVVAPSGSTDAFALRPAVAAVCRSASRAMKDTRLAATPARDPSPACSPSPHSTER